MGDAVFNEINRMPGKIRLLAGLSLERRRERKKKSWKEGESIIPSS
jgi:hypothetical protein